MIERVHQLIQRSSVPPQSVIQLLKQTTIGTAGSLYQLLDTETKIHELHQPNFIYLERNGRAIGNMTICNRDILLNGKIEKGLYLRYFAFESLFQGGKSKGKAQSNFHNYFKALFNTSNFNPVEAELEKSVYWGFIDPQNLRSFNMNERVGFESVGTFTTTAFSRVNPKKSNRVSKIKAEEKEMVIDKIRSFYEDANFFSPVHLFDNDDFYVLKENNQIIAGIQANPVSWKIKSLPGFSGKLLLKYAHKIPRLKKLINPQHHRFLATEGLFWKKGCENQVQELLEGVLHLSERNSLLIWTDNHNKMLQSLTINWGFIQKTKVNNEIHIVAKFNGYSDQEIKSITQSSIYLSGFDMT